MKVSKELYATSQFIISNFDADHQKTTKLDELKAARPVIEKPKPVDKENSNQQNVDLSIKAKSEKWDKIGKQIDIDEQIEETEDTDFEAKQKEYMAKMTGCSKDHAKEIDLYNKTYADKIDRVKTQMKQAR